jgi:hypothetical protein
MVQGTSGRVGERVPLPRHQTTWYDIGDLHSIWTKQSGNFKLPVSKLSIRREFGNEILQIFKPVSYVSRI